MFHLLERQKNNVYPGWPSSRCLFYLLSPEMRGNAWDGHLRWARRRNERLKKEGEIKGAEWFKEKGLLLIISTGCLCPQPPRLSVNTNRFLCFVILSHSSLVDYIFHSISYSFSVVLGGWSGGWLRLTTLLHFCAISRVSFFFKLPNLLLATKTVVFKCAEVELTLRESRRIKKSCIHNNASGESMFLF